MKRINMLPQGVWMVMLLLCLTYAPSLFSQSLTIFDIDASAYPVMRAKFYAFDANGHQVSSFSPNEIQLSENGTVQTITNVYCPPVSPPTALSSVLTIDISGSMRGSRIQMAKAASNAWIEALPLGRSECAVTSHSEHAFINQDFTTDRTALLHAINALRADGENDFDAAFLYPPAGALEVCKRGQYKKMIVFLSDGLWSFKHQHEIIAEAQRQNVTVYSVMLGMPAPLAIREICEATGGLYLEQISTGDQAADAFRRILQVAQGGSPCELEWISEQCATIRKLEMVLGSPTVTNTSYYAIPALALSHLMYTPSHSLRFGKVAPGTRSQQIVTLTAQGGTLRIERVTLSDPRFNITTVPTLLE